MLASAQELVDLLARIAQRDQDAFAILYHATSAKLYGIVLRILSSKGLADDVLQEVFVKVWDHAADFDPSRASPITWLATIARNRALDEVRRVSPISTEDLPKSFGPTADTEHPLEKQERSEALRALMKCLAQLDTEKRQIVLLAYYHGMSREALAKRFGHPVPTIKTWLHRSLAQLKICLAT